ncbi:hypothetical protein Bca52824_075744 [Brassica carinata]|uniref:Uncharacterized protein n=1 Tax=Brassica carinata TaxID=52824 RepID=A0A8X7PSF5_BRACI|nr:hypothetical protein Bca52824_075744 [Brassica carinata]
MTMPLYNSHGNETSHLASVRLLLSSVEKTTRKTTSKPRGDETMKPKTKVTGCDDEYASSLQLASQIPRRRRRIMAGCDDEGHGRRRRRRW